MNTQASVPAAHQPSLFSWPLLMVCGIASLLFVLAALPVVDRTMTLRLPQRRREGTEGDPPYLLCGRESAGDRFVVSRTSLA